MIGTYKIDHSIFKLLLFDQFVMRTFFLKNFLIIKTKILDLCLDFRKFLIYFLVKDILLLKKKNQSPKNKAYHCAYYKPM